MVPQVVDSNVVDKIVEKVIDVVVLLIVYFTARNNMPLMFVCLTLILSFRLIDIRHEIRKIRKE